jgi:hypothetical protein
MVKRLELSIEEIEDNLASYHYSTAEKQHTLEEGDPELIEIHDTFDRMEKLLKGYKILLEIHDTTRLHRW